MTKTLRGSRFVPRCSFSVFVFLAISCPIRSTMYSPCSSPTCPVIARTASVTKCDACCHAETSCAVCFRPILTPVRHTLPPSNDSSIRSALEGHIVAGHDPGRHSHYLPERLLGFSSRPQMVSLRDNVYKAYCCAPSIQSEQHHEDKLGVADQIFEPRALL